ncbi:PepSY domain-containing protein [Bacillus thermotolerans]|uniref:PepSY domain-containing protein n=1 Tax=Bacillus thermotolerans TaxID=1221996 RepID=UPI0005837D5A|nr:PepSY domain-containing protein [Bacillus thermotolerans]KKB38632.1 hypothetical protein QY97_01736 [Bacillus thermotolerans]
MKRKLFITGVAGAIILGGAIGVGAVSSEPAISFEKAKEAAVNQVNGTIESIELEEDDGLLKYDIEVNGSDRSGDKEVEVDAASGKVMNVEDDRDDDDDRDDRVNKQVNISHEEAINIALKSVPGKVTEAELDDDGYYEIEVQHNNQEVELKVDADSGKVLEKEID